MSDGQLSRLPQPRPLSYQPLERLLVGRPVDRIAFIRGRCRGLNVLDLGALDETAFLLKQGTRNWLHSEIARTAACVVGADLSKLIPSEGLVTAPNARIYQCADTDLGQLLDRLAFQPDVVIAGELIEHVPSPLAFLVGLKSHAALRGRRLMLTTPNASAFHNATIAVGGCESTHQDHLCILSYKTLSTLLRQAGFERFTLIPYFSRFSEMASRHIGWRAALVRAGEFGVNGVEWMFPMLSFGWIVEAEL